MKNFEELKESLKNGIVEFSYKKKDGTIRNAKGTINPEIVKEKNENAFASNGRTRSVPDNVQTYYDVVSDGWRTFIKDNVVYDVN